MMLIGRMVVALLVVAYKLLFLLRKMVGTAGFEYIPSVIAPFKSIAYKYRKTKIRLKTPLIVHYWSQLGRTDLFNIFMRTSFSAAGN